MTDQWIQIHLMAPLYTETLVELLEDEGYEVEVHEGEVLVASAVDIVGFAVDLIDEAVVALVVSSVAEWIRKTPLRNSFRKKDARISITDNERSIIINVSGNGNYTVVHESPLPQIDEEE